MLCAGARVGVDEREVGDEGVSGRDVEAADRNAGDEFEGRAEDVNRDGALLIRRPDGEVVPVIAGEVTLRDA